MSGELKMPGKGKAALLLSELNAEHAHREQETNNVTNVTTLQPALEETNQSKNVGTLDASNDVTYVSDNESANGRTSVTAQERTGAPLDTRRKSGTSKELTNARSPNSDSLQREVGERELRMERALNIAQNDDTAVVTIRVSGKLNKYIDDYVERINRITPRHKYRKQDAIAEAFAAFYADHVMPPAPVEEEL